MKQPMTMTSLQIPKLSKQNSANVCEPLVISTFRSHFTADKGESVAHFLFFHHFGRPHYRACICKYDKISKLSVYV